MYSSNYQTFLYSLSSHAALKPTCEISFLHVWDKNLTELPSHVLPFHRC